MEKYAGSSEGRDSQQISLLGDEGMIGRDRGVSSGCVQIVFPASIGGVANSRNEVGPYPALDNATGLKEFFEESLSLLH